MFQTYVIGVYYEDWVPPFCYSPLVILILTGLFLLSYLPKRKKKQSHHYSKLHPTKQKIRVGSAETRLFREKARRKVRTYISSRGGPDIDKNIKTDNFLGTYILMSEHYSLKEIWELVKSAIKKDELSDYSKRFNNQISEKRLGKESFETFMEDLLLFCREELKLPTLPDKMLLPEGDCWAEDIVEFIVLYLEKRN